MTEFIIIMITVAIMGFGSFVYFRYKEKHSH
jgi:hypothetical protein